METVVFVMMILVCFIYMLKQTWRKRWFVLLSAVVCMLAVGLTWPWAIEQSKNQISRWLADSVLMLDLAVILTIEVSLQIAFCILAAHIHSAGKVKPVIVRVYRILRWFPGLLIFPVLFSILVATIFALPGVSFPLVAWGLATVVFVVILVGTWGLRRLFPEKDIRLELLFMLNIQIATLGVIATVNGQTAVAGNCEVDWTSLCSVLAFVVVGLAWGSIAYHIKSKRTIKIK